MGNVMSYNSDHLNQTTGQIGQASSKAGEAQGLASSGFTGMNTLFGSGIGEISKQLGSLQGSLTNVQGIMTRHTESMFNMDTALASVADAIEVPQDFVKNEANRFTEYHDMLLEKLDGKTVNEGKETDVKENLDPSMIGSAESLGNITTATEAKEEVYDASSAVDRQKEMANVNRAGGDELQKLDARSAVASEEKMANINNGAGLSEQELRDQSRINAQEALRDMTGTGGSTLQSMQEIAGNAAQTLGNVSNGQDTEMQELDFRLGGAGPDLSAGLKGAVSSLPTMEKPVASQGLVEIAGDLAGETVEEVSGK
jgi:hypothetical protein